MKNVKFRSKISFLLLPLMVLYVFIPCISQAAPATYASPSVNKVTTINIQATASLTYFYNRSTLMNSEDDNGNMSTYLGRTVRSIVNVNTQTVVDTQCLFTDGKNVISQTDSTGTNITSTQQYNAYGQPVNYNSDTDSKIPKSTNQPLSIATNPFQYDGYYYDPESGLYYLNARYYSPTLMQFVSMDTYDLANRYAYCDGNPIGNVDPTGHDAEKFFEDLGEGLVPFGLYFIINGYETNNESQVKAGWITFGVTAVSSIISGIIGGYLAKKAVSSILNEQIDEESSNNIIEENVNQNEDQIYYNEPTTLNSKDEILKSLKGGNLIVREPSSLTTHGAFYFKNGNNLISYEARKTTENAVPTQMEDDNGNLTYKENFFSKMESASENNPKKNGFLTLTKTVTQFTEDNISPLLNKLDHLRTSEISLTTIKAYPKVEPENVENIVSNMDISKEQYGFEEGQYNCNTFVKNTINQLYQLT